MTGTNSSNPVQDYFEHLGQDINNFFTAINYADSFGDFVNRAVHANGELLNDVFNGDTHVKQFTQLIDKVTVDTVHGVDQTLNQIKHGDSVAAIVSTGVANAIHTVGDVIEGVVPQDSKATTTLHQIHDTADMIAKDVAATVTDITNSKNIVQTVTTAINHTADTITNLVTHFDTSVEANAISHAVTNVVHHINDSANAIYDAVTDAAVGSPIGGIHAAGEVLKSVSGIATSITDAVVATNDPATLDQKAIAGVHDFANVAKAIAQLPTDIGAGISGIADQVNHLIHTTTPNDPVLGQVSDGLNLIAHDVGLGLSDVLNSNSLEQTITSGINTGIHTITDLVAYFDPNPQAAGIAHTVNTVVHDATHIADTIYGAVTGANVAGIVGTATDVANSLAHMGHTIAEQVANSHVTPPLIPHIDTPII